MFNHLLHAVTRVSIVRLAWVLCAVHLLTAPACAADAGPQEGAPRASGEVPSERLILFGAWSAETAGAPGHVLEEEAIWDIEDLAAEMDVPFRTIDVGDAGAPREIGITPAVVFVNHLGHHVYRGRYTTLGRLRSFIHTARAIPADSAPLVREGIPVWRSGRTAVAAPIKITDLTGSVPDGFVADAFRAEMARALTGGMPHFTWADRVALGATDRMFYVDLHPYRAANDDLFVSVAVFSQFHCHDPIFVSDAPVSGRWAERGEVFARAGAALDGAITAALERSRDGDGFRPVAAAAPAPTWDALGLGLPPSPRSGGGAVPTGLALPVSWTVDDSGHAARPPVRFRFAAPMDIYTGHASGLSGTFTLGAAGALALARGRFEVRTASVTMGEQELDDYLHGQAMMNVAAHPVSTFTFDIVRSDAGAVVFGRVTPATLAGRFALKGMEVPLEVPAQIEAIVGEDGAPRLIIEGSWRVNLADPFRMEAPEGPEDVRRVLLYSCTIVMAAAPAAP